MKILMVSPEVSPLAKTGGLADAVGGLSRALARLGTQVSLVMPAYQGILESGVQLTQAGIEVKIPMGQDTAHGIILETRIGGNVPVYLIRADAYFLRADLYGTSAGDYPDNAERFVFFSRAALDLAEKTGPWDVLHCNDWQSALVPVLKKVNTDSSTQVRKAKVLLTIHNLAYQGTFPTSAWRHLNLNKQYLTAQYLEFYNSINFLKGGILFADAVTTVSRKYAREIKTPEYGCGLDGVILEREKDLYGILNGADYEEWNPETDPHIKRNYGDRDVQGKRDCKKELQQIYGLPRKASTPLLGMVSRLVDQKGVDILLEGLDDILQLDLQLVILGAGLQRYQETLANLSGHRGKIGIKIGFDNVLAHKIEAGADLFLMPSRYEPCGLNQIYSLKYGTIPIVRATGGLDDTIQDYNPIMRTGNGFKFSAYSSDGFLEAIKRAVTIYSDKKAWRQLMANAMACDFSWEKSATEYLLVYRDLLGRPEGTGGH